MTKKSILASVFVVIIAFCALIFILKRTSTTVTVERSFNAPVEKIWALWNDSQSIKKWWSPKNFTAPVIQNDFRVGGNFLFSMKASNGDTTWNTGTYKEIIPLQKIVSVMSFADETGKVVPADFYDIPGHWPDEVTLLVEFKSLDGKTVVTVQETGIPTIMSIFAKLGWQQQFDKLDILLK